jgi:hypothetical protein
MLLQNSQSGRTFQYLVQIPAGGRDLQHDIEGPLEHNVWATLEGLPQVAVTQLLDVPDIQSGGIFQYQIFSQ